MSKKEKKRKKKKSQKIPSLEELEQLPFEGPEEVDNLAVEHVPPKTIKRLRVKIVSNGMGDPLQVPVVVARGKGDGPIVGITAATHGNELNGLPVIFEFLRKIKLNRLKGTIVAVPVINIPGFLNNTRYFTDRSDLNRLFPGKSNGTSGQIYAYHFFHKIASNFEYLIDLHTASFGRLNSLYVRADLTTEMTAKMAYLQRPQIVVHNTGTDGTLRNAAMEVDIPSITLEIGNPLRFQRKLIRGAIRGINNVLSHLKMLPRPEKLPKDKPVICGHSFWMYTDRGGVLEIYPTLTDFVEEGELVARLRNVFGDVIQEYYAPETGIVVGRSHNPVGGAGSRIVHLGVIGEPENGVDLDQFKSKDE